MFERGLKKSVSNTSCVGVLSSY